MESSSLTRHDLSGENMTNNEREERSQAQVSAEPPAWVDSDNDSIPDSEDNCPTITNQDQLDSNYNGIGDVCDQSEQNQLQR